MTFRFTIKESLYDTGSPVGRINATNEDGLSLSIEMPSEQASQFKPGSILVVDLSSEPATKTFSAKDADDEFRRLFGV